MILVVADASPIRYLVLVEAIDVLPRLFDRVVIPDHVARIELRDPKTPQPVQAWAAALPEWAEVRVPVGLEDLGLHRGEAEAIALATELKAYAVLLDDANARRVAVSRGLSVTGTLGILEKAAERGLISLPKVFGKLRSTNFRVDPQLLEAALNRVAALLHPHKDPPFEPR